MGFRTGFAANECELHEIIHSELIASGWTLRSKISDFDRVYFSSGEDGYKDIYLRCRAKLYESSRGSPGIGGRQIPFTSDGYVGYLNFFVYQYFPENGDGYDGYGEAGLFGPRLFFHEGFSNNGRVYYQNIATQNSSNRKFGFLSVQNNGLDRDRSSLNRQQAPIYAGLRKVYGQADNFYRLHTYDLFSRTARHINETGPWSVGSGLSALTYYFDKNTRKEYIYFVNDPNSVTNPVDPITIGTGMSRIDVETNVIQRGLSGPIGVLDLESGSREGTRSGMVWDEGNFFYYIRNTNTNDAARYDIRTDTWVRIPDLPHTSRELNDPVFLNKENTGFVYSRLYIVLDNGNLTLWYLDIDDFGDAVGTWQSAGQVLDLTSIGSSSCLFSNGINRLYLSTSTVSLLNNDQDNLIWAKLKETGSLSWNVENNYFPIDVTTGTHSYYVDGYYARVKTTWFGNTKYWLFVNKNFMTVVTRYVPFGTNPKMRQESTIENIGLNTKDLKYDYCYAGAIDPYASTTTAASTTANVSAGTNVLIPIQLFKGEFSVGDTMFIADITGNTVVEQTNDVEGKTRKFIPVEQFTITNVDQGVSITADQLNNNYSAGSKIAFDPQPVGITLNGLDRIQMLNHINTVNDLASTDMGENVYRLVTARADIVKSSGGDARRNSYGLWPLTLSHSTPESVASGDEVRGKLINVFAISNNNISPEESVSINQNAYTVFEFDSAEDFFFAVGPIVIPEEED